MNQDSGERKEIGLRTAGLKRQGRVSVWEGLLAQRKVRKFVLAS